MTKILYFPATHHSRLRLHMKCQHDSKARSHKSSLLFVKTYRDLEQQELADRLRKGSDSNARFARSCKGFEDFA